jgi:hypothetical protein
VPVRFYLLPVEEIPRDGGGQFRIPKYITVARDPRGPQLLTVRFEFSDFGLEPTCLMALDVTNAEHTLLVANADVTAFPLNLDNNVGGQLGNVQAALESLHLSADAVTSGTSYRQVLRGVVGIFGVARRFAGPDDKRLFPVGVTLSTTLGDFSLSVRTKLREAAETLGYNYSSLTLSSTLRDVLKAIANQSTPGSMLGVTI